MATILILTQVGDAHALAVATVLERRGHRCVRWFGADFPARMSSTFLVSPVGGFAWKAHGPELELDSAIDVVWLRRMQWPHVPADELHPDDVWFAEREARHAYESIWLALDERIKWVNPPAGAQRAYSKVMQLKLASEIGFDIPDTIVSNDPEEIRSFLARHRARGAVYKASFPATWRDGDRRSVLRTARVTAEDLPGDALLRLTPGIFQEVVPKAHELRVTFMGSHNVALRIHSHEDSRARLDWRLGSLRSLSTELCELPAHVQAACIRLMERLGILFGCFDFIVTPDGRLVFLEVNEAGQFLFVERLHPDARLLDAFCEFLLSPSMDFEPTFSHERVHIDDLTAEPAFRSRLKADADAHLVAPRAPVAMEDLYRS